jgi:histidyl-tRNA synthetase
MFTLEDRKGRKMAMRPEGTAAVVRALIQNGLDGTPDILKYYYTGPMFRYERPQKGRLRQFHQFGGEVFGSAEAIVDADLIESIWFYFETLKLPGIELHLNSLGDQQCRPVFREALLQYLNKHQSSLCVDCQRRLQTNPLRVLDCKEEGCAKIVAGAPIILDFLCEPCKQHLDQVTTLIKATGRSFQINPRIARGLDYYNRTVFEFVAENIGAKSTVCGGGRYDDLVTSLGGKPTPAIGFAMGIERLILLLEVYRPLTAPTPAIWIAYMGEALQREAFMLSTSLRRHNLPCYFDYQYRSLKNQLGRASKQGAKGVLILGEDEIKTQTVTLKDLASGQQQRIDRNQLVSHLEKWLKT